MARNLESLKKIFGPQVGIKNNYLSCPAPGNRGDGGGVGMPSEDALDGTIYANVVYIHHKYLFAECAFCA